MPVIDFHVHVGLYEHLQPWVVEWMESNAKGDLKTLIEETLTAEGFRRFLEENGLDYAVCQADISPLSTGTTTNEFVAELAAKLDRFIPMANINPYLVPNPGRELERLVRDLGFRALKLQPTYQYFYPNDRLLYPLYAKAEELRIPVMFHTGSSVFRGARIKYGNPVHLDDVAVDFPDLNLVMAHSGRGFWYQEAFFLARLHPNLYMEIAGLPAKKLLDYFPEFGRNADKIIFGSDWPGNPWIKENVAHIRSMPISEDGKRRILGDTAARLLGLH